MSSHLDTGRTLYSKVTWTELLTKISNRRPLQYEVHLLTIYYYYKVYVKYNNTIFYSNIYFPGHVKYDSSVYDDFVNNYKPELDSNPPTDSGMEDGTKIYTHETSRKIGTTTYFTGRGDDQTDDSKVGGDVPDTERMKGHHQETEPTSQYTRSYFNCIDNETHVHEGYLQWLNALNDEIIIEIIPKVTDYTPGTDTFYNLYGGYLIIPAAGDGTIDVAPGDIRLVQLPLNEHGKRSAAGFWDADYNTTTLEFENIQANPYGTGEFNMFGLEVSLDRFVNGIPLLGNGFMCMQTADRSMIGHNMAFRVNAITCGADHEWWWNAALTFHRKKTV